MTVTGKQINKGPKSHDGKSQTSNRSHSIESQGRYLGNFKTIYLENSAKCQCTYATITFGNLSEIDKKFYEIFLKVHDAFIEFEISKGTSYYLKVTFSCKG